jgi:hypothetical protein
MSVFRPGTGQQRIALADRVARLPIASRGQRAEVVTRSRVVAIGVDKNTTVAFPALLMSTIGELDSVPAGQAGAAALRCPSARRASAQYRRGGYRWP